MKASTSSQPLTGMTMTWTAPSIEEAVTLLNSMAELVKGTTKASFTAFPNWRVAFEGTSRRRGDGSWTVEFRLWPEPSPPGFPD